VSEAQFHSEPDAPNVARVREMAHAALAAYAGEPREASRRVGDAFPHVRLIRARRFYAFVAWNDAETLLAFRGTDEERQWMEAVTHGQATWFAGRAHGGLIAVLDNLWTHVLAALFDADALNRPLYVTGHSLGGALAVLAGQRLDAEGWPVSLVATFGAPPVLDQRAAERYPVPLARVVNNEDAIPAFGWPALWGTYRHVGREWLLTASGRIAEGRHGHDLARRIDRAFSIGDGPIPSGPLHDHAMERYVAKLDRLVDAEARQA
jgi:triacylglycerol lipase